MVQANFFFFLFKKNKSRGTRGPHQIAPRANFGDADDDDEDAILTNLKTCSEKLL